MHFPGRSVVDTDGDHPATVVGVLTTRLGIGSVTAEVLALVAFPNRDGAARYV